MQMADIIEREVKLKLESPTLTELYDKLLNDGMQLIKKETEEDIYFNSEFRDFRKTDEALRIRKTDSGIEFTYKGPKIGKISKSREEITVNVNNADNLIKILEKLGFKPVYTVVKNRIFLKDGEFIICLDSVKGSIFLVVVDPGVGTSRKALLVKSKNYFFIGPDNGVLYPAISEDGIDEVIEISNPRLYLSKSISRTFHGRDIFATTAGFVSAGVDIHTFGPKISKDELVKLSYNYNIIKDKNLVCGKIIYIDHFGNIATSIRNISFVDENVKIIFNNNRLIARKVNTFGIYKT
jgi:predicted adenylyl cyclase CyaB